MSLELGAKLGLCAVSVRIITRSTCHTILRSVGIIFADVTDEHLIVCRHQLECIDAPTSRCGSTMSDNVRLAKCTAVSAPTTRTSVANSTSLLPPKGSFWLSTCSLPWSYRSYYHATQLLRGRASLSLEVPLNPSVQLVGFNHKCGFSHVAACYHNLVASCPRQISRIQISWISQIIRE